MYFYKNKENGEVINSVSEINDERFMLLVANTTNGATEKHLPVYSINDNSIYVKIGEVDHPMSEEHYIMWIALVSGGEIIKINLKPGDAPEGMFDYKEDATIYSYCNLHGLWKVDIK